MISLFLSVCLAGEPCREERVADFYTSLAISMCETNMDGMQVAANAEKRTGKFTCRNGEPAPASLGKRKVARMDFKVCQKGKCDVVLMATFYGSGGEPLCARNSEHYRPILEESAKGLAESVSLDCISTEHREKDNRVAFVM